MFVFYTNVTCCSSIRSKSSGLLDLDFAEREMGVFFPTPGDSWPSILAFDPAFLVDCGLRMLSLLKD